MAIQTRPKRIPMSREQFEQLPEGPPFYDYVNGGAVEVNRPSVRHQDVLVCLTYTLRQHVRTNDLGLVAADVDVALPTGNVYGPDIVFLSKEHLDRYDPEKGDLIGTPDLIVEILSPSTASYDRMEKLDDYYRAGVPWVWFVEQETLAIEEYQWTPEGYLRRGSALPGQGFKPHLFPDFEINLSTLMGE